MRRITRLAAVALAPPRSPLRPRARVPRSTRRSTRATAPKSPSSRGPRPSSRAPTTASTGARRDRRRRRRRPRAADRRRRHYVTATCTSTSASSISRDPARRARPRRPSFGGRDGERSSPTQGLTRRAARERPPGSGPQADPHRNTAFRLVERSPARGTRATRQDCSPVCSPPACVPVKKNCDLSGEFRSGRQDLNLRPPGPQPERSGRSGRMQLLERVRVALSWSGCAQFGPRIGPRGRAERRVLAVASDEKPGSGMPMQCGRRRECRSHAQGALSPRVLPSGLLL